MIRKLDCMVINPVFITDSAEGKSYQTSAQSIYINTKEIASLSVFLTPTRNQDGTPSQTEFAAILSVQLKGSQPQSYAMSFLMFDGKRLYNPRTATNNLPIYYDAITVKDIPQISAKFSKRALESFFVSDNISTETIQQIFVDVLTDFDVAKLDEQQAKENDNALL